MKKLASLLLLGFLVTPAYLKADLPLQSAASPGENPSQESVEYVEGAELGSSEDSPTDAQSFGFERWGLAKKVHYKILTQKVETSGEQLVFLDKTQEICWFGKLGKKGQFKTMFWKGGFSAEWFSPDKRSYFKENLSRELGKTSLFTHSVLKLPQPLPETLLGVWEVKVFKKDQLVDVRRFKIIKA